MRFARRLPHAVVLCILLAGACKPSPQSTSTSSPSPQPAQSNTIPRPDPLRAFEHAALLKPPDDGVSNSLLTFAPIIAEELADTSGLDESSDNKMSRSHSRRLVYAANSQAEIFGQTYDQAVYYWFSLVEDVVNPKMPELFWLRITVDDEGLPRIWEFLSSGMEAPEIFVSQSLETRAKDQYGDPLPGREFAIERAEGDGPAVNVIRVLNDGPVSMGPFVYVDRDWRMTTILCRCMASQIKNVALNQHYDLRLAVPDDPAEIAKRADAEDASQGTLFLPPFMAKDINPLAEMADPQFLETALRLPADF